MTFHAIQHIDALIGAIPPVREELAFFRDRDGELRSVPDLRLVVHAETEVPIARIGPGYGHVTHEDMLARVDEALATAGLSATLENFCFTGLGSRMTAFLRVPDIVVREPDHHEVSLGLLVHNSIDGSSSLRVRVGAFRFVCLNMLVSGHSLMDYRKRHSRNIHGHLDDFTTILSDELDHAHEHLDRTLAPFRAPFRRGTSPERVLDDVVQSVGLPGIMTPQHAANHPWTMLNDFTHLITHEGRGSLEHRARFLQRVHTRMLQWIEGTPETAK